MKKTIKTCSLLTLVALFGVSCGGKQDLSNIPNLETKMMEDFSKGKTDYFNASHGWTNGSPFAVTWNSDNVDYADDKMSLEIKKDADSLTGGELKSKDFFHYRSYSVKMKPMKVNGTASTFFTYTGPSDNSPWDEIDIEFLGKDTTKVQFNYFTNGKGDHEYMYDLGFDASLEYHEYGFRWSKESIVWFVDKKPVYEATKDIPTHPQRIMMNAWCGDEKGKGWMGMIPDDFTSSKAYYEEIGFQDENGKAYEPTFEIEPDVDPDDAKWADVDLNFASTDLYTVNKVDGASNVTYKAVAPNSYQNINAPLPVDAKKANAIEFKIKNNGSKTVDVRADVNQLKQVGKTRCINKSAKQDGKAISTDLEWGGSAFSLKPGQESKIEVLYEGPASELMFMIDTFTQYEGTRSGDITIKDIKLGTYGDGQNIPEEPIVPDIPEGEYRDLDVNFTSDAYTITKNGKVHEVTYKDVAGDCYKNIATPLGTDEKGHQKIQFTIKNNGDKIVKARTDVNQAATVGNTRAINLKATQDGTELRTDFEWGGSFFDLNPQQESVIEVEYNGDANEFMIFLDSMTGNKELSSGNVTVKDIKIAKLEDITEPDPENPSEGVEVDPIFATGFENYKISKDGKVTTVNYEGVKFQTYQCINAPVDYQGKKSINFKIKNNTDKLSKLKVDVIKGSKSVNTSATFDGKEIYTDLVNGGSSLDLGPNAEGIITINFEDVPDGLNIFIDSVYDADTETLHSGSVSFSEFLLK